MPAAANGAAAATEEVDEAGDADATATAEDATVEDATATDAGATDAGATDAVAGADSSQDSEAGGDSSVDVNRPGWVIRTADRLHCTVQPVPSISEDVEVSCAIGSSHASAGSGGDDDGLGFQIRLRVH